MIMFYIEHYPNTIGKQLGHHNILSSECKIRIAKYESNYNPIMGFGYNLEIHFKLIIKHFKRKKRIREILYQKFFLENINRDILKIIEEYLY